MITVVPHKVLSTMWWYKTVPGWMRVPDMYGNLIVDGDPFFIYDLETGRYHDSIVTAINPRIWNEVIVSQKNGTLHWKWLSIPDDSSDHVFDNHVLFIIMITGILFVMSICVIVYRKNIKINLVTDVSQFSSYDMFILPDVS